MYRYFVLLSLCSLCLLACDQEAQDFVYSRPDGDITQHQALAAVPSGVNPGSQILTEQVEALIAQLKSPTPNPILKGQEFSQSIPKGFDEASQSKIGQAKREIIALGIQAFPALISHVDDKHFSMIKSSSIWQSFSVGQVCEMIIKNQVSPNYSKYQIRLGADGKQHARPDYFISHGYVGKEGLQRWWEQHQHMPLLEIQLNIAAWQLQAENNIGYSHKPQEDYIHGSLSATLEEMKLRSATELK